LIRKLGGKLLAEAGAKDRDSLGQMWETLSAAQRDHCPDLLLTEAVRFGLAGLQWAWTTQLTEPQRAAAADVKERLKAEALKAEASKARKDGNHANV
jgi:hypothetical protein